jgi:NurA domain
LQKGNFYEIKTPETERKIAFIDGGNQEILPTPEYSVQVNRVYFNIFKDNKRIILQSHIPKRIEFLSFTSSKFDGNNIFFETKISPVNEKFVKYLPDEIDLRANALEEDVKVGTQAGMERMASMARRFAEWTIAEHIIDTEMDKGDIIVKDGSLQTSHINENKYVERVFQKAKDKGVIFTGLSKTCRLTTINQISLIASIQKLAIETNIQYDKWCYYPVARVRERRSEQKSVIMVVKLNRNAVTPYRFEIFKEQADQMNNEEIFDIVSTIAINSRDIMIPGYPYGLIDADMWARVKNEEVESYKTRLYSEISKMGYWETLNPHIKAIDTHDKLDEL